jgi:hypothetical protein
MGYALFVTFDRSIPDVEEWNMCGKTLAQNIEQLDNVARHLRVTSLSEMICVSQEDLEELLDEAIETDVEEQ